jgi:hypothetical protein
MNQHKLLTGMAIASFLIPSIGLATIPTSELVMAAPVKISKVPSRKPFYSRAGRFSIDFPGKPNITNEKDKDGTYYSFLYGKSAQNGYLVMYRDAVDMPNPRERLRKEFLAATSAFQEIDNAVVSDYTDIKIGNNIGFEFKIKISEKIGLVRTYIVGKRIYVLAVGDSPQENAAFLNSFRLR